MAGRAMGPKKKVGETTVEEKLSEEINKSSTYNPLLVALKERR